MTAAHHALPRVCFVGLENLPVLAREYGHHRIGGAEVQQTLLARALARSGFDVSMVVANYGQPDGATWDRVRTYRTYRFDEGIPAIRFLHPRWTSVWSALQRADADVYYVSGASMLVALVTLFARRHGRKVLWRSTSQSDCDPRRLCIRFWRDKQLYAYGLKRVDLALAQTLEQQHMLLENYGRTSHVVGPLSETPGRSLPFAERDLDVLWVGNIRALKRPRMLFDLARRLPQLQFAMAGGACRGEEDLFASVQREAGTLANVRFHGPVAFHQMPALFERARLLVGTSEVEGFPNTYLQAWAHGAPVVAFLDPEAMIANRRLGRAVATLAEMEAAITELLTNEREWAAASERCRAFVASRTDETAMLAPYLEAVRSLGTQDADASLSLRARQF